MGSLYKKGTPLVPIFNDNEVEHRRQLAEGVHRALRGLLNNVRTATLGHNVVSTSVSDQLAGPDSLIVCVPTNLNGATALDKHYIATQTAGSFVITHVSTSTSDCTLKYAIFG